MVRESLRPEARARRALVTAIAASLAGCSGVAPIAPATVRTPPPAPREFRAAWVACVANIDWPSRPGLAVAAQQAELRAIVERARSTGLNALIVQVRPAADAIYDSPLEPWSEYLTGEQGRAPDPWYDPLAMWIDEAHRAGLELHAWFNPYRARHKSATGPLAASHVANTTPGIVKTYGEYLWLDPGEARAATRTLQVILDVVRRYDIDGVHIDDYFYPYPVPASAESNAPELDFPDEPSWQAYLAGGGTLARADWRRSNVDALIEGIYAAIHREKPWVRFGVSPFGLGRPDRRPPVITGFSQYDKLYADVERWLAAGWLDYLVPQLYWPIEQVERSFAVLLDYWRRENVAGRHVWPGLFTSRIDDTPRSWPPIEILNQVALARRGGADGHVHFSAVALAQNRRRIADLLRETSYPVQALVPAAPWLGATPPPPPRARVAAKDATMLTIELASAEPVAMHGLWARYGDGWIFRAVPATAAAAPFALAAPGGALRALIASSFSRTGIESERVAVELTA